MRNTHRCPKCSSTDIVFIPASEWAFSRGINVYTGLHKGNKVLESSHWNAYALTLPITPRDLVISKYLIYYGGMYVVGLLASLFSAALDALLFSGGEDAMENLMMGAGGGLAILVIYSLIIAVDIPLYLKLGTEKSRIPSTLTFLVPFVAIFPTVSYWGPWLENLDYSSVNWPLAALIALVFILVIIIGSCVVSIRIMEKKEY